MAYLWIIITAKSTPTYEKYQTGSQTYGRLIFLICKRRACCQLRNRTERNNQSLNCGTKIAQMRNKNCLIAEQKLLKC